MEGYKEITVPVKDSNITVEVDEDTHEVIEKTEVEVDLKKNEEKKTFVPVQKKGAKVSFGEDEGKEEHVLNVDEIPQHSQSIAPKPAQKKPSRANARIRELASEKNELKGYLDQALQENATLRQQLETGSKKTNETLKSTLTDTIAVLQAQLKSAVQNAEADRVVEIQDQLMDAKLQLSQIQSELSKPLPKQEEFRPVQQQPQVSDKALDWIDAHPEFKTSEEFYTLAMITNNRLLQEGFDSESDDFYAELDARLSKRFPELFGVAEENDVEYREEVIPSSKDKTVEDVKTKAPTRTTVSGASRTPAPAVTARKQSNTVKLTPQEVEQAERWGWDLTKMAKRKLHIEKNRREDGYVPIVMKD